MIAMATNFGTNIVITGFVWTIATRQLVIGGFEWSVNRMQIFTDTLNLKDVAMATTFGFRWAIT